MLAYLLLYLVLVIRGPSIWDRLLAMNLASGKIVLLVLVFASLTEISYLLDYAFIYVLSGFVGTIFITLFWSNKRRNGRGK